MRSEFFSKNIGSLESQVAQCSLCAHYCKLKPGQSGLCDFRINHGGIISSMNYGMASALAVDPIEKKPFYHFFPGSQVLSVGTPGCNFSCLNCQNYSLSHAKNDNSSSTSEMLKPEEIAALAEKYNIDGIAYTYSEPTVFFEYAKDIIRTCKKNTNLKRLPQMLISNGYFSKELFEYIDDNKLVNAMNIDLKFMNNSKYKHICGAKLQPVLDNIERVYNSKSDIHLEIINLVIPGENDSDTDFHKIADFIKSVSPEIPLHFSAFHPTHKMSRKPATDINRLLKAKEIAEATGVEYVYIGNSRLPGVSDTKCPNCGKLLIAREGYTNPINNIVNQKDQKCPQCGKNINILR